VLHIITNSLEFTLLSVLEDGINNSINGTLNLVKVDGPDIVVHLSLDTPCGFESWLSPLTEAFGRYDLSIRLIESLKESTIDIFQEFSVGLDVVKFLSIILWAALILLKESPEWLVLVFASLDSDHRSSNNFEHF